VREDGIRTFHESVDNLMKNSITAYRAESIVLSDVKFLRKLFGMVMVSGHYSGYKARRKS